jgi:hypothetical protein
MGGVRRRAADRAGRARMRSPGRLSVGREERQRFWRAIARGVSSEEAAAAAGVSSAVGVRWFREGGGMPSVSRRPLWGRYLSFSEREEIALLRAGGAGSAGDRAAASAVAVEDLAGAASERRDPRRPARVPRLDGAVARRRACVSAEAGEARHERRVAAVRAGAARGDDHDARRRGRGRARGALDRPPPRSPQGIGAGRARGALSRSPIGAWSTFPMIPRCGSRTRPSTSRSTCKAVARWAAS